MPVLPVLRLGSTGTYVQLLQEDLNGLGSNLNNFSVDGRFGLKTQQAVGHYQDEYGMPRTGIVGPAFWRVLTDNVKAVQRSLNALGYHMGQPDGWFGQTTSRALVKFQRDNRLYTEGIVNPRTRRKLFNPYPKDNVEKQPTSSSLSSLHPRVARMARRFLTLTKADKMDVRILTTFRSWDEQDHLYAQGRTTSGSIITNARGGGSYHNWGLAFDAAPFENGVISSDLAIYEKMGKLGIKAGLDWGGHFKDIIDRPHFQYTFGYNVEDLLNGVTLPKR